MRPSVTQRHAVAAVLQHAERRGELVQLRHAVGARALEADRRRRSRGSSSPALKASISSPCEWNTMAGASTTWRSGFDRRDLYHGAAEIAGQHLQAAGRLERDRCGAQHLLVLRGRGAGSAADAAVGVELRLDCDSRRGRCPRRCARPRAAGRRRAARRSGNPCRRRRGSGSRRRARSDRCAQCSGTASERSEKSSQVTSMPAARAMATRCSVWLVEPPVACRPTTPLTMARSSIDLADRGVFVAERGDGEGALRRFARQRIAQRRVGVDEGRRRADAGP